MDGTVGYKPAESSGAKWLAIINPSAAGGSAAAEWPLIDRLLRRAGITAEAVFTAHRYHAVELTVAAVNDGIRHIIAVGGDTTLHEVVNGLFIQRAVRPEEITLGIIPTGNCRIAGIPKTYPEAVSAIASGYVSLYHIATVSYSQSHYRQERLMAGEAGMGLYAMLASVLSTLYVAALVAAQILLFTVYRDAIVIDEFGSADWVGLTGFGNFVRNFYMIGDLLGGIVELIYVILLFILLTGLYKKYYAKGYLILSWVGLFLPVSRYIVVFVLRNNKAIDYEAYMRAKREEYMRRNPYGPYGPYGGPYNPGNQGPYNQGPYNQGPYNQGPYNQGPYGQSGNGTPGQSGSAADDPFAEFAPGASSGTDASGKGDKKENKDDDDLFN